MMSRFQPVQPPMLEHGLLHEHYQYVEYTSAPALRPFVCCYWSSAVQPQYGSQMHRIVPDGCIDIIFDLYATDHRGAFLSSLMRSYEVMELAETMAFFGIRLYASEVRHLLGDAGTALTGIQVTLEQWLGTTAASIQDYIVTAPSMQQRIGRTDRWLLKLLRQQDDMNTQRLHGIVQSIHAKQGRLTIRELAQQMHYSERTLRRLFQQELGISPKEWSDMIRFQAVLHYFQFANAKVWPKQYQPPASDDVANAELFKNDDVQYQSLPYAIAGKGSLQQLTLRELAVHFGYYDQAHLNLAFQRYYGVSPGQLIMNNYRNEHTDQN
ncbi:AraC family transcriptional regulator [Paenibacillus campi]|uniref:AraC family transcriptional regulator n=1 Tax=Paenibacillus campi TaxID=3106031 RepID=UPI002AFDD2E2|nr:AraC family transcriptional regulator [Paenibacillus sp. SGZ-1014]